MALTTGGGGGGGHSISEVLLGSLQIFENLYSTRVMWMLPTYSESCELVLRLQGHRDPKVRAAVMHVLLICALYNFVRFTASSGGIFPAHRFVIMLQSVTSGAVYADSQTGSFGIVVEI